MYKTRKNPRFFVSRKFCKFSRKSQGLSVNVIIIVAIALIVLIVLIAVFTGRLGNFVRGLDTATSCESNCDAFGMDFDDTQDKEGCDAIEKSRIIAGTYSDIPEGKVCCCVPIT